MAIFSEEARTAFLSTLHTSVKYANIIFTKFRVDCKYRKSMRCMHEDHHKDFALANICCLENCPMVKW